MQKRRKIAFHTLGCKLNFSETSSISRQFNEQEFEQVPFSEQADVYVINSCSVTRNAEKTCKELIRKAHRTNPEAHIAVVGCFSQINPAEISAMEGVGLVLGNADKYDLFGQISRLGTQVPGQSSQPLQLLGQPEAFFPTWSKGDRTRSYFKIQDGCDYHCSYCTIPLARGKSRSNTIAQTIATAREIARSGAKEIILTGVNIGDFGKQNHETFYDLLKELVIVDGIERIRISSVEPDLLHQDIIELVAANSRLMPHFHIPLQSGSNEVLKAMGRRYTTELFSERVEKIRFLMPLACIAVDLIVGFPAETDGLFEESYRFIEQTDISYLHVFTYSQRDNTRALAIRNEVTGPEKIRRRKAMQDLSERKKGGFLLKNMGSKAQVLWEKETSGGIMHGFTENYIKVMGPYRPEMTNQIQEICLQNLNPGGWFQI
ncbi:MAG TPA: tRNA (N(6)-L-threonylcarbamoyladenosine(37)-C(2))-methylthiotransferase MtaB [Bacteroidales bacterium]|nr:tRNA (N(6)-L-threonylcarbamoyladenosine(37)-C(2))-methylthiotransferase MtaB [Bacteroidales bacterium]